MLRPERIIARRAELGISQAELARRVGVSQPMITGIEKGRVQDSKYVLEIAAALDLPPAEIDPRYGGQQTVHQPIEIEPLGSIPVFKLLSGVDGSVILTDPISYSHRPPNLVHVRSAYALLIDNEEMSPEFEPGDVLFVNPHLPTLPGYSYVFSHQRTAGLALIRRLHDFKQNLYLVEAWSEKKKNNLHFGLDASVWLICDRIVGKQSRG